MPNVIGIFANTVYGSTAGGIVPLDARIGWTDGVACVGGGDYVIRFSDIAHYISALSVLGVEFIKTPVGGGGDEVLSNVTDPGSIVNNTASGTSTDIAYTLDWVLAGFAVPVAGDVITFSYTESVGDYYREVESEILPDAKDFTDADWNLGAGGGWVINGDGTATCGPNAANSSLVMEPALLARLIPTEVYRWQFEIFGHINGNAQVFFGGSSLGTLTGNGFYDQSGPWATGFANDPQIRANDSGSVGLSVRGVSLTGLQAFPMPDKDLALVNCLDLAFKILLQDDSGSLLLQDGTGFIILQDSP